MTLLRESFGGINARFHLVGLYATSAVLSRISFALAVENPEWALPAGIVLVIYSGVGFGISGLVFQEASRRRERIPFGRYVRALFLPLLWLWLEANLIVSGLFAFGAASYFVAVRPPASFEEFLTATGVWAAQPVELAMDIVLLYAWPLCILSRERGERRAPIREGWRLLRLRAADSLRLLLLPAFAVSLKGGLAYARGVKGENAPPDVPEVLIIFAGCYLELVALYGAARVVLERATAEGRDGRDAGDSRGAGDDRAADDDRDADDGRDAGAIRPPPGPRA
ncbi:MAG TPA: hypothetical protein VJ144_07195 [Candidatus Polarisedimenticolia bacterium]|nr:hypothetical protein [Candidatus Polarisedimenticolia bacterium]